MKVVVDTNVIFSALIAAGKTRDLILLEDLDLLIPEFFYNELKNNEKEIISKTSLTESEFSTLLNIFFKDVAVIPKDEFEELSYIEFFQDVPNLPKASFEVGYLFKLMSQ